MGESENAIQTPMKYVAFCDVLGFSNAVLTRFDETIAVYTEFMKRMRNWPFHNKTEVSIYSDSILIVADELPPVLHAVKNLWFATMPQNWMIRGGIAYGRYFEQRENGHLFVVSDALVRAVQVEKKISFPAIGFSDEIILGDEVWVARFEHGVFNAPVLQFNGLSLVNPFNPYWFASARIRVAELLEQFPQHKEKYTWFLALSEAVGRNEPLVPEAVLARLVEQGIIQWRPGDAPPVPLK